MTESEMLEMTSGETLNQRLRYLSQTIQRQLQRTESRHREELDSRIHQYIQLSLDFNCPSPQTHMRRAASTLALTSDNNQSNHFKPKWQRVASCKTTKQKEEEEAEAECKKKFSAHPVPIQVKLPLYQEMVEKRDKKREQGLEHRKSFLLSFQKPFSFQEREKKKRDKMDPLLMQVSQEKAKTTVKIAQQSSPKQVKPPKDKECCRESRISITQQENHEKPKLRVAERNRIEKLGFLDEKPSFRPKINHQVPDFKRLHQTLQTECLNTSLAQHMTKCQPFYLRTSTRPARQSQPSPETSQKPSQSNLGRSKSCDGLKSLSRDTLPTYITDATRKRSMAIRTSMDMLDVKKEESADWLRKYQNNSEALRKTVSLHAKLLDPHKSLREVYDERLQHHREADRQKTRDYMRDLKDIKARVRERPLLFEQVKQRNAKARVEQAYKNELRKAGIKEHFVEEKGRSVTVTSSSSRFKDDSNPDVKACIDAQEENLDNSGEN
ncbi:protein FAM161B isoform X2 [Stigmatopora argus]